MDKKQLDSFFSQYEKAFDKLDMKKISGFCADSFITAGPKGSMALKSKENEKREDEVIKFYKTVGRRSAKIVSKRVIPICNEYTMVVIRWGIGFEKTGERLIDFDISYIIQETGPDPRIILLISHADEEDSMKKFELQPVKL